MLFGDVVKPLYIDQTFGVSREVSNTDYLFTGGVLGHSSSTSHTYTFNGDTDTGIGSNFADQIYIDAGGSEAVRYFSGATIFNQDQDARNFQVKTEDTEYMFYIDNATNAIGIFEDIPRASLHIGQGSILLEQTASRIAFGDTKLPTTGDAAHIVFMENPLGENTFQMRNISDGSASTSGTYSEVRLTNTNTSPISTTISFIVSNTEAMLVDNTGNVGIKADDNINTELEVGGIISGTSLYSSGSDIDDIYVNESGDTMTGKLTVSANVSISQDLDVNGVLFADQSAGFLGVGTDTPQQSIHSYHNSTASRRVRLENSEGYADFLSDGGSFQVLVDGKGSQTFVMGSDGNVSIGDVDFTPDAALEVVPNGGDLFYVSSSDSGDGDLFSVNSTGNTNVGGTLFIPEYLVHTGNATTFLQFGTNTIDLIANSGNGVHVNSSANVGIGDTSPATRLEIDCNSNSSCLRFYGSTTTSVGDIYTGGDGQLVITNKNSTANNGFIDLSSEDDNYGIIIRESDGTSTGSWLNIYVTENGSDDYATLNVTSVQDTDALVVDENNNVGVGKNPNTKLDVSGAVSISGDLDAGGAKTLFVDSSANRIGINTQYPKTLFHVAATDVTIPTLDANNLAAFTRTNTTAQIAEVSIIGGNNGYSILNFGEQSDEDQGYVQLYNGGTNRMDFGVNKATRFQIDGSGNVSATGDMVVEGQLFAGGENLDQIRTIVSARSGARGEIYLRDQTSGFSTGSTTLDGTYLASDNGIFSVSGQNSSGSGTAAFLAVDQPNGRVGVNTSSPDYMFNVKRTNAGDAEAAVSNQDTTSTSDARFIAYTLGGAGDSYIQFQTAVAQAWYVGIDNSDSDDFEIGTGFLGPGGHAFKIDTNEDVFVANDLDVGGTLTKGGGSFKIDHPLKPDTMNLQHSFVESPEMRNLYFHTINTKCDKDGCYDKIYFPDWFIPLNGDNPNDYTFQITPVGGFCQYYVKDRKEVIESNSVTIVSNKECELDVTVSGIRHDKWAKENRIQVETEKTEKEKQQYLERNK